MNGYQIMAESYREMARNKEIEQSVADKYTRIYDFLAECDHEDICILVDSSAFNEVIKAYLREALRNTEVDEETKEKIGHQLNWLFDLGTARDIMGEDF